MLIGIDASRAVKEHKTGTEHYSEQIIFHISELDKKNNYILYAPNMPKNGLLLNLPKNFKWKIMPFPKFWSQIRLSWELKFGHPQPDVMFEPAHTIPIWYHKKSVVTLHDLGFKHFTQLYTPFERFYHNWCMNFSAKHAQEIITPSEYTKQDLIKIYNIAPKKITPIYHGYDQALYNNKKVPQPKNNKLESNDKYIFYVGRIEEKKNIYRAILAFNILRKNTKIKHKFVLAGKPGWGYEKIEQTINLLPLNIQNDIIELGYTSNKDLVGWMKNADIFFFPTLFEGFGLPIIEAMASGIPVVSSNTTCIPEIAKNAAVLINPNDETKMAQALEKIILDKEFKNNLIQKGHERIKFFSWKKAAYETLEVIYKTAKK